MWTDSGLKLNFEVDAKCEHNGIFVVNKPPGREIKAIPQETLQDLVCNVRERLEKCIQWEGYHQRDVNFFSTYVFVKSL